MHTYSDLVRSQDLCHLTSLLSSKDPAISFPMPLCAILGPSWLPISDPGIFLLDLPTLFLNKTTDIYFFKCSGFY